MDFSNRILPFYMAYPQPCLMEDVNTSPEKWEWIKDMVLLILYYEIYKRRHSGRKGFIKF